MVRRKHRVSKINVNRNVECANGTSTVTHESRGHSARCDKFNWFVERIVRPFNLGANSRQQTANEQTRKQTRPNRPSNIENWNTWTPWVRRMASALKFNWVIQAITAFNIRANCVRVIRINSNMAQNFDYLAWWHVYPIYAWGNPPRSTQSSPTHAIALIEAINAA